MRTLVFGLAIWVTCGLVFGQTGPGAVPRAFKGVELYSWKDCASCEWQFALLPGTNRLKTLVEIKEPARAISGVAELKQHLSRLPAGEVVIWRRPSSPELSLPDPGTVAEIVTSAEVKITVEK